jgi:hypothetical protein
MRPASSGENHGLIEPLYDRLSMREDEEAGIYAFVPRTIPGVRSVHFWTDCKIRRMDRELEELLLRRGISA